ncbi:MAG: serine/threonine protein kinase [Planctomycetes bacterium]|nr:serine/threonine protein kinase [Planctomycetota bacterium]
MKRAVNIADGTQVAVKFLAPDPKYIDENVFDDVLARFRREGLRGARLEHAFLVRVRGLVENENGSAFTSSGPKNPFLLMEYMQGKTLENYVRRRQPDTDKRTFVVTAEKLKIAIQIADALCYVHSCRMVHRDVKPVNVFLSDKFFETQEAKLGDFGIMKWGDFNASLTTGQLTATSHEGLGTLKYMSPEQAVRPKEVTAKADVYSFGITLFELFTDQVLLSPHHVFEVMFQRLQRGTVLSRYANMGIQVAMDDSDVAELILEMHLRGATGRPSMELVRGTLRRFLETRFGDAA